MGTASALPKTVAPKDPAAAAPTSPTPGPLEDPLEEDDECTVPALTEIIPSKKSEMAIFFMIF